MFASTFSGIIEIPSNQELTQLKNVDMNSTVIISTPPSCFNGTYKKKSKFNDVTRNIMTLSTDSLDDAYQQKDEIIPNSTFCKNTQNKTMNETFPLEKRMSVMEHLNDEHVPNLNETYDYMVKRNSAGYSGGSADSLDRMSSLSNNSSRGSNRMLNMAEVDAIVERQEQSLQVMSTPKPTSTGRTLCDSLHLSPIGSALERSDSDISSSDEYVTGRTSLSKASPTNSDSGTLHYIGNSALKTVRSANAILQANQKNSARSSYNNLTKNVQSASSYTTIQKLGTNLKGSLVNLQKVGNSGVNGSQSNLRTLKPQLRGSYTSLKPVNKILPVAPPPLSAAQGCSSHPEVNRTVKLTRNEVGGNICFANLLWKGKAAKCFKLLVPIYFLEKELNYI